MNNIKHYLKWKYFTQACTIIFLASLIASVFSMNDSLEGEFYFFGFPFSYLTIHVSQNLQYAVHLGLGNLILDLIVAYFICLFVGKCKNGKKL